VAPSWDDPDRHAVLHVPESDISNALRLKLVEAFNSGSVFGKPMERMDVTLKGVRINQIDVVPTFEKSFVEFHITWDATETEAAK
jgi:hypothetical protein